MLYAEENADLSMVYGRPAVERKAIVHSKAAQLPAADMASALEEHHSPEETLTVDEEPRTMTDEQKVHVYICIVSVMEVRCQASASAAVAASSICFSGFRLFSRNSLTQHAHCDSSCTLQCRIVSRLEAHGEQRNTECSSGSEAEPAARRTLLTT